MVTVTRKLPDYYPKQASVFESSARFKLLVAGTKSGKTWGACRKLAKEAINNSNGVYWYIVPDLRKHTPQPLKYLKDFTRGMAKYNKTEWKLHLVNGTTITFMPGRDPDRLCSQDVHGIIFDECALLASEVYDNARTTLTQTQGWVNFISVPRGKGWFYERYKEYLARMNDGDPSYIAARLTAYDNPEVDDREIERARKDMPEIFFKQQWLAQFLEGEAFLYSQFAACQKGSWIDAKKTRSYVMGIDLGHTSSWTVVSVFDTSNNHLVYFDRYRASTWTEIFNNVYEAIERFEPPKTNGLTIYIDASGPGRSESERMHDKYLRGEIKAEVIPIVIKTHGDLDHPVSSMEIIREGGVLGRVPLLDRSISFVNNFAVSFPKSEINPLGPEEYRSLDVLFNEMEDLGVFGEKYKPMSNRGTDDCLISLSLATLGLRNEFAELPSDVRRVPTIWGWGDDSVDRSTLQPFLIEDQEIAKINENLERARSQKDFALASAEKEKLAQASWYNNQILSFFDNREEITDY